MLLYKCQNLKKNKDQTLKNLRWQPQNHFLGCTLSVFKNELPTNYFLHNFFFQAEKEAEERIKQLENDNTTLNVRGDLDDNYVNEADFFDAPGRQQM